MHPTYRLKFPIGTVLNKREIVDIKTLVQNLDKPQSKGSGKVSFKKFRKVYLLECLVCHKKTWQRLDGKRGTSPVGCANCGGWSAEKWAQQGRFYQALRNGERGRKTAARKFLISEQIGVCKLCKQPLEMAKSHIDHDHQTDIVRGLVHPQCNHLIGVIELFGFPASVSALLNGLLEYLPIPPPSLGPSA